jgi:cytochrome c5
MLRNALTILVLAAAAAAPPAAVRAAEPTELTSVSVDLPDPGDLFPAGPGSEAIDDNCLACHSADMVLNQPARPKAAWAETVHKMIAVYKAPIAEEDVGPIVDYLAHLRGDK